MDYTEKKLRRLNTYEGIIINVGLDRVSLPDGSESFREIVEHPGGACILPVDGEGNAYCVRQYRYPIGEHLLEAPAGKLERGEDPLVCAVNACRRDHRLRYVPRLFERAAVSLSCARPLPRRGASRRGRVP